MPHKLSQLRAAVIGPGFMGGVHVDALRRLGVKVHGLLGETVEEASSWPAADGVTTIYHDLDELAADDKVDVVHITTPNFLHAKQALAMLAAGKNVICEKPLALTLAEAGEMVKVANQSGLVVAINFNSRFYPMTAQAKALVQSGQIGDVRLILGSTLQDWLALETDWSWRIEPELGGRSRAVSDIGSHWTDLVEWVSGDRITEVFGELATFIPVRQRPSGGTQTFGQSVGPTERVTVRTEDAGLVLARFASGARGQMTVSQVSQGHDVDTSYEMSGSKGSIAWRSSEMEDLWVGHRGAANELLRRNPAYMTSAPAGWLPAGHMEGYADAIRAFFQEVYTDVLVGAPSPGHQYATFDDGLRAMQIEDAIIASAQSGTWAKV